VTSFLLKNAGQEKHRLLFYEWRTAGSEEGGSNHYFSILFINKWQEFGKLRNNLNTCIC
jgi:hypothetical protein